VTTPTELCTPVEATTANSARKLSRGRAASVRPMKRALGSSPSFTTRSTWRSDRWMVAATAAVVFSPRSAHTWANLSRRSLTVTSVARVGAEDSDAAVMSESYA